MGSSQSIPTASEITYAPCIAAEQKNQTKECMPSSKNGPKTQKSVIENTMISLTGSDEDNLSIVSTTATESDIDDDDDDYDYEISDEEDEDDDDLDEFIAERKRILAEANQLKSLALGYLQPEKPAVCTEPTVFGRNYFHRASAITEYDDDDNFLTTIDRVRDGFVDRDMEEERERIFADSTKLKEVAEWYLTPNKPVAMDGLASARSYYSRPSAPRYYDDEEVDDDERNSVLADAAELKKVADWYLNREKPIASDASIILRGRNYFSRPSAPRYDDEFDDEEERDRILEESADLKKFADFHLHPEKPIVVDPTSLGRNYFDRLVSVDDGSDIERETVLREATELKMYADWHLNRHKKIQNVDPTSFGRNYFSVTQEDHDSNEREQILAEAAELKKVAGWFANPDQKVQVDAFACGRNYFTSASNHNEKIDADDEREKVLADVHGLKKYADYNLYPEKPVLSEDPTVFGRNYFNSSPDEAEDDNDERERILADVAQLKKYADYHLHPEKPVASEDPTIFGKNYFSSSVFEDNLREQVLDDVSQLKKYADYHLHPEKSVITEDPTLFGRNYFSSSTSDDDDNAEREQVLDEVTQLKKVAGWFNNPKQKIEVDPAVFGRNYFSSSVSKDDDVDDGERESILKEAAELKKVAEWYHKPSKPVVTTDPTVFGRNFFSSGTPQEDEDERKQILEEAAELKKIADWHMNREKKIEVHPECCARNFFSAPTAEDDNTERDLVLGEAAELKKVADWHMNRGKMVDVDSMACASNYFSRTSSYEVDNEEKDMIITDALELKKMAVTYYHPEKPITPSSVNCARNYFDRPSAKANHSEYIHTQGYANNSAHMDEHFIMHHDDYHHYDDYHHHDDISHGSVSSHGDHFMMDEDHDVFHGFRESINAFHESMVAIHDQHIPAIKEEGDGKEGGNLSRSPSSIMLFQEQAM